MPACNVCDVQEAGTSVFYQFLYRQMLLVMSKKTPIFDQIQSFLSSYLIIYKFPVFALIIFFKLLFSPRQLLWDTALSDNDFMYL